MHTTQRTRAIAGALAALWLLLPVEAAVHGALKTHEFCLEHQAFEHGTDAACASPADGGLAATSVSDKHEACSIGNALFRAAIAGDAPTMLAAAALPAPGAAPVPSDHTGLAALISAPKTSPPSLAV